MKNTNTHAQGVLQPCSASSKAWFKKFQPRQPHERFAVSHWFVSRRACRRVLHDVVSTCVRSQKWRSAAPLSGPMVNPCNYAKVHRFRLVRSNSAEDPDYSRRAHTRERKPAKRRGIACKNITRATTLDTNIVQRRDSRWS